MHRAWRTWSILLVLGLIALGGMSWMAERVSGTAGTGHDYGMRSSDKALPSLRLVSLAPSLTETVFALGAGSQLVGVTTHCAYPPEAAALPKVGSYQGPNYEAIYALNPDLVLLLKEHAPAVPQLQAAGLATLMVDQRSWSGLLASFDELGRRLGRTAEAEALRADFMKPLEAARAESAGKPKTRLLLVIGRAVGAGGIRDVYVAGKGTIYDPVMEAAGCVNAYEGELGFPVLSAEGIVTMGPDVVVELLAMDTIAAVMDDIRSELAKNRLAYSGQRTVNERRMAQLEETLKRECGATVTRAAADWDTLKPFGQKWTGNIRFILNDYAFVPGPRFSRLAGDLIDVLRGHAPGKAREASHAAE